MSPVADVAEFEPNLLDRFRRFSFRASVVVTLLACGVLVGWWQDIAALKSMVPGTVAMNPLTALAFILSGVSLAIASSRSVSKRARMAGRGLGLLVTAIGATRLFDYLFNWNLGLDALLFPLRLAHDTHLGFPNRMAPNTALCFVLSGTSLIFLDRSAARRFQVAEALTLVAAMIAALAVVGYAYSALELYRVASFIPMALNTAVAFALLCAGILCARPERGITAVLTSKGAGSIMARRILPVGVSLLLVIGWLAVLGQRQGFYGLEFGSAFFATASIVLLSLTVWWTATSLNRTETARRREEQQRLVLASRAMESATESIVIADRDGRILSVNPAFTLLTGHAEAEVLGKDLRKYEARPDDAAYDHSRNQALRDAGYWQGETWLRAKTGELLPNLMTISTVRDEFKQNTHFVTFFKDLSQYKRDQARLEFLAHHDPLTHLANRERFLELLHASLARAGSNPGIVNVLLINLDRFHAINDSLGNPAGDLVLQSVARRLSERARQREQVASLGGNSFAVLIESVADTAKAAERYINMVAEPFSIVGYELRLSASIGIACHPQDGEEPQTLLKNAEAAMRGAKQQGGNSYRYFSTEMNDAALEQLLVRQDLHRAIEREEFFLAYQPRISLASGRITGVEALIRWQHPQRGLVSPAHFITIAEDSGLIEPIGEWVNSTAIRQLKTWLDSGIAPTRMAINLSARQFRRDTLVDRFAELLARNKIAPELIEIEITESMAMDDPAKTKAILSSLKELGVAISIDDFGTGHSSLSYLKSFPIDYLKIDQSFIRGIPADASDIGITRSIIALAKSLDLGVIAEGVETEAQKSFLIGEGCDEMQGYLFSKPRRANELLELLMRS